MSGDARTLPLRDPPAGGAAGRARRRSSRRANVLARTSSAVRIGALSLLVIVACSALVVVIAADRPSILSPTSHANFFPHWMAGPLGGIWPGFTRDGTALRY